MKDGDKEYEICKQACINAGCHCPPSHEFHSAVANTNMFLRVYFHAKGFEDCNSEQPQLFNVEPEADWFNEVDSQNHGKVKT